MEILKWRRKNEKERKKLYKLNLKNQKDNSNFKAKKKEQKPPMNTEIQKTEVIKKDRIKKWLKETNKDNIVKLERKKDFAAK